MPEYEYHVLETEKVQAVKASYLEDGITYADYYILLDDMILYISSDCETEEQHKILDSIACSAAKK